eukprot:CAMPEP_0198263320 /NCGR_PEP_ID=MMETSP1447-20131203/11680_1 /TAXON_ID=420782 /ORGANISM="Chaetoceros dichaeta, Strain CCMP1751" /LENGTH=546 /DNA_ID=CAMNT_0043951867 /DNA_START=139 /DNA_END=1779 /DNA_ORIENTATION=-
MADWFLIVSIVVAFFLLCVVAVYFLVHYQHPDDKNDAYLPKLTVLIGFILSGATVLLLPLDVANNEGYSGCDGYDTAVCGGLNMLLFWNIIYLTIPIFIFLLIPFMTFYYEADDGLLMAGTSVGVTPNSRIAEAIKYEAGVVLIFGTIFLVMYFTLAESAVPVVEYRGSIEGVGVSTTGNTGLPFQTSFLGVLTETDVTYIDAVQSTKSSQTISVDVTLMTFFAAFMTFLGWFFFAIFGGIGLAALPLDLILGFLHRPKHMDAVEFAEAQVNIRSRVNELVDVGELMKIQREERKLSGASAPRGLFGGLGKGVAASFSKTGREERSNLLEFKKAVYLLETDVEEFQNCSSHYNEYNPLIPYFSLVFGVLGVVLSLAWVIQICIGVLPNEPLTPFLNGYLRWFDRFFPLFGVLSVAILSLYLLLCALKGAFKFGLNFVIFQLHPMAVGKTYMSSFLFNIALVLLCALPVVQFTTTAFSDYARFTTVGQVFGIQIRYMKFFAWFWESKMFVYILVIVTGLTTLYLSCCKKEDRSKSSIYLRDRLRNRT